MSDTPHTSLLDGRYVIGVDVGTGSARAGLFDLTGKMLASAKRELRLFHEPGSIVEQSSTQIWQAVCAAVRETVERAGVAPEAVVGLGFDATCSLVVLGDGGRPLPVGPSEDPDRNVILWMDHRAVPQAERINALGHEVLRYVGGRISPEMETPKLLWLKENRRQVFDAAWQFLDLADFLTWRASGDLSRSTCTVTCKWTYLAHESRWDAGYFHQIGLGSLADEGFSRIGTSIVEPGSALGKGLTEEAARELGLEPGTAVAAGLIDAHAGGIGTVGIGAGPQTNIAYVFGTSSCTMTSTEKPAFVDGVWGPYFSAMVPGLWLNEGGQSAAGAAIDQLVSLHPASRDARARAAEMNMSLTVWLSDMAGRKLGEGHDVLSIVKGLHVVPEFIGNRAPFADPHARAVISGLGMEEDTDSLIALYLAGVCGLGYGLRQIIDTQAKSGVTIDNIVVSGGAGQSDVVRQILADATGKPVVATIAAEPVLLGAAILGAVAGKAYSSVRDAMDKLAAVEKTFTPSPGETASCHAARYAGFKQLQSAARSLRDC
jgi:D-ribulokinase